MDIYGIMAHDGWPSQAARIVLIPWGASALTLRSQPLYFIHPGVKPTSSCKGEEAMKAVLLTNDGGPEMLGYGEAPDPTAGPGEVVVDIHAASVNAADYKVRLGGGGRSNIRFPHILGRDFSGVVSAVGTGVTDLTVGEAVFGVADQGCNHRQEARPRRPCRGGRHSADQPHRAVGPRGYGAAHSW